MLLYLTHSGAHLGSFLPQAAFCICCAGIMHLFGHVTHAQSDSGYTAYFPIGVFFITLGFMVILFLQRVLGPLLTPAGAEGASCCAAAVPLEVCTNPLYEISTSTLENAISLPAVHAGALQRQLASLLLRWRCAGAGISRKMSCMPK